MFFFRARYCAMCAIILLLFCAGFSDPSSEETLRFPLHIRVSRCDGELVRNENWIGSHIEEAKKIFEKYGIDMEVTIDEFTPQRCELVVRRHRHRYAEFAESKAVNVLVAKRVQDLDVPSYNLMGVHWRYRGNNELFTGRRWIFLASRARPPVLAHEICHFFGLRHDVGGGNLMTPGPSDPSQMGDGPKPKPFKPILTDEQVEKLKEGIRLWTKAEK